MEKICFKIMLCFKSRPPAWLDEKPRTQNHGIQCVRPYGNAQFSRFALKVILLRKPDLVVCLVWENAPNPISLRGDTDPLHLNIVTSMTLLLD